MIFPEKLRTLLRRRGLSARGLADKLELSNSTVAGWMKTARPQAAQAKQLAEYFKVPVATLLDENQPLPLDPILADIARENPELIKTTIEGLQKNLMSMQAQLDALKKQIGAPAPK